ncbi:MAG: hypothetical protein OXC44_03320 [Proteobacteria bacterium]|nr:hypothetical protein [Pseudomonadota bacterium]
MYYPKHITAALSLLFLLQLCIISSKAFASENSITENSYLLKDTDGAFALSSCATSNNQPAGNQACFTETFLPENEHLLAPNFTEVHGSVAVVPVTGAALLASAGSWSKHLYWLPQTALTKWALFLAGGAVVVGYLTEKFAATSDTKEVFLSSGPTGRKEGDSLTSSQGEEQLSSTSPEPKPLPPPVVSKDADTETETTLSESDTTPLWESMDDKAFNTLLNDHNIDLEEYEQFEADVVSYAKRRLHVSGTMQGDKRSNIFYEHLQEKSSDLSEDQRMDTYEKRYILDAAYFLLADVFKLINNGTLRSFQNLNLVKDGYALYTQPLLLEVAIQMPRILQKIYYSSSDFKRIGIEGFLEIYSHAILEDFGRYDRSSMVEQGQFLDSKYSLEMISDYSIPSPSWIKDSMYHNITSKTEKLQKAYISKVKKLLSMISTYHNNLIWDFFKLSSDDPLSRVSRTRILESLMSNPAQYLKNHPKDTLFTASIYNNPLMHEAESCLKLKDFQDALQDAIRGCNK